MTSPCPSCGFEAPAEEAQCPHCGRPRATVGTLSGVVAPPGMPPVTCNAGAPVVTYWADAVPTGIGNTGVRRFGGNQNGTVFFSMTAALPVTQSGNPAGGTPIQ